MLCPETVSNQNLALF